jgi:NAD(P) transhydrogenase
VAYYREVARGQISGHTDGRLKILFHRESLELLGVHIFGENATERLHIGQAVFKRKGKITYFIHTAINYPTLAECYKTAAFLGRIASPLSGAASGLMDWLTLRGVSVSIMN